MACMSFVQTVGVQPGFCEPRVRLLPPAAFPSKASWAAQGVGTQLPSTEMTSLYVWVTAHGSPSCLTSFQSLACARPDQQHPFNDLLSGFIFPVSKPPPPIWHPPVLVISPSVEPLRIEHLSRGLDATMLSCSWSPSLSCLLAL